MENSFIFKESSPFLNSFVESEKKKIHLLFGLVASHLLTAHSGFDCASMHLSQFYSFHIVVVLLSLKTE